MGLFGGLGKRLRDGRISDGLAAAQATLAGDPATAMQINHAARQRRAEAERSARLREAIAGDPGIPAELRRYFDLEPNAYLAWAASRLAAGGEQEPGNIRPIGYGFPAGFNEQIPGYAGVVPTAGQRNRLPPGLYQAPDL